MEIKEIKEKWKIYNIFVSPSLKEKLSWMVNSKGLATENIIFIRGIEENQDYGSDMIFLY